MDRCYDDDCSLLDDSSDLEESWAGEDVMLEENSPMGNSERNLKIAEKGKRITKAICVNAVNQNNKLFQTRNKILLLLQNT